MKATQRLSSKRPSLKTVELFAGIGGFRIAADSIGLQTVWANDIDAKACSVYRARFGDRELREGDIRELAGSVPPHDILTAGFPCQPFSSAGKKQGIEDPRGTLFQSIVDVLRRCEPQAFVLENVKRLLSMGQGNHFATILAALTALPYDVEWRLLNTVNFGLSQNRERVILVGRRRAHEADDVDPLLAAGDLDRRLMPGEKLAGRWTSITAHGQRFPNWGIARDGMFFGHVLSNFTEAVAAPRLREVLERDPGPAYDFTESTRARLAESEEVNRFVGGVQILSNQGGGARMGYTVFGIDGVAPTLTAATSRHYERYKVGNSYRRLTPREYARLQGFPDDHCDEVSVYDQYGLYGNAVPPPLVRWVLSKVAPRCSPPLSPQLTLLDFDHDRQGVPSENCSRQLAGHSREGERRAGGA